MILYIGNKLSKHGYTPTNVETLGRQLGEFTDVISVSDKQNKLLRVIDMSWSIIKYRKIAKKVIIDTYSTSNFYFTLVASQLCRLFKVPYIPILHGGSLPERLDRSPLLSQLIFKHSFINIAPSGYLLYEFKKRGYDNIQMIPNNIDINEYKFTKRKIFAPKLLWVRAFDKIYNCTMAVEVLAMLAKKYPDTELCMVGPDKDGSMQLVIDKAKELNVTDKLKITGRLTKSDWHRLSEQYDLFINTTNFDNTPVSVVEAMALGLLVVSTDVGGVPYLISNSCDGFYTKKGDAKAMTQQICSILEDQDNLMDICDKARKKAESFSWSEVRNSWKEVLA